VLIESLFNVVAPPLAVATPAALVPLVAIVESVMVSVPPPTKSPEAEVPLYTPTASRPLAWGSPKVVMATIVSDIDEPVPTSEAPGEPSPVAAIVAPLTLTLVPAPSPTITSAIAPEVEYEPPLIVVEPSSRVRTACDSSPDVANVELVSVIVPP
jgi:hypothetical protein